MADELILLFHHFRDVVGDVAFSLFQFSLQEHGFFHGILVFGL
jgi:hypothetical protein